MNRFILFATSFLLAACNGEASVKKTPLDISNDHFVVGGQTSSGYWKLDIKAGHAIYSSASFDAPIDGKFSGFKSKAKTFLDNGNSALSLLPSDCDNPIVKGNYSVTLELSSRVLSGCALRQSLPDVRTISASGNEPFWNFRITGEEAVYSSPEMLEGITIPVTKTEDQTETHYSGQLHGSIFTLSVTETPCEDDMSGYAFPMTVRLRKDGNSYNGCARLD